MFESIFVRGSLTDQGTLDGGLLAEVILFYGEVHLLVDRSVLTALVRDIGTANLLRMFRSGYARGSYTRDMAVIHTEAGRLHMPTQVQFGGMAGHNSMSRTNSST